MQEEAKRYKYRTQCRPIKDKEVRWRTWQSPVARRGLMLELKIFYRLSWKAVVFLLL